MNYDIAGPADVEHVRREARRIARSLGWGRDDVELIVLVVSELATNLLRHARDGQLTVGTVSTANRAGIEIVSQDTGLGIDDINRALKDGFSTRGGFGSGLPAVRRLVDDLDIKSGPNGTRIVARKWKIVP